MYNENTKVISNCKLDPAKVAESLDKLVPDNRIQSLVPSAFQLENESGINALFILAHSAVLSGYGRINYAILRRDFFNFGSPQFANSLTSVFKSGTESVETYAKYVSEQFINTQDKDQKADTVGDLVSKYPVTSEKSVAQVVEIMNKLHDKASGPAPDGFPEKEQKNAEKKAEKPEQPSESKPEQKNNTPEDTADETEQSAPESASDESTSGDDGKKN